MDKKMLTIVLAVVLIGCFFLDWGGGSSGFDGIKAEGGGWHKYVALLIPISGVMLLIGAMNNGNYIGGRGIWIWLPFLAVLFIIFFGPLFHGVNIGDIFKGIGKGYGIGWWITIAASLVLAFYNPNK
jgi:hypothetical protein